jgi:hypothetical protein
LPPLFVSNEEFAILEEVAKGDGITVVELLKTFISDCVEGEDNVVVVNVPHKTSSAFAAFFNDEPPECAMARFLDTEGEALRRAVKKAQAGDA